MMLRFITKPFLILLAVVISLFIYREAVTIFNPIHLFYDEAYYLGWAQSLEWGYYSKPPMVGWLIHFTTALFGNEAWAVKLAAPVLYSASALLVYKIAQGLFDHRSALFAGLIFILMPMVSFNSLFITTDAPQVFFWSLALWCFFKAIRHNQWRWWFAAGIVGGCGLLSKYTFIFLPAGFLLYAVWSTQGRELLVNGRFWFACLLAVVLFIPNLIWNAQHDFISFQHTAEISQLSEKWFHFDKLVDFWLGQFAVLGPVFLVLLVRYAFMQRPFSENEKLLWCFVIPTIVGISFQAVLARANINWAATAYVAAPILLGYYLSRDNKRTLLIVGLTINLLMAAGFYHYHAIANWMGVELTRSSDPYSRILGWQDLAQQIQPYVDENPELKLASDSRDALAYFGYYLSPQDFSGVALDKDDHIGNHYELKYPIAEAQQNQFLFISKSMSQKQLLNYFEQVEPLADIVLPVYPRLSREVKLYKVSHYKH